MYRKPVIALIAALALTMGCDTDNDGDIDTVDPEVEVDMPEVDMPEVDEPELPEVDMPEVDEPELPEIDEPEIDMPDPDIDAVIVPPMDPTPDAVIVTPADPAPGADTPAPGAETPASDNPIEDPAVEEKPAGTLPETGDQKSADQSKSGEKTDESAAKDNEVKKAVVQIVAVGDSGVSGTVHFEQKEDGKIHVHGEVTGLSPGKHGFHVHESGDLSDKQEGKSTGGHFNPKDKKHGKPEDSERHVGDLGNIEAGEDGKAKIDMTDDVISLNGEHSIVGRAIVIHADPDDFSQPTGNAGSRVAFGKIEADKN